MTRQTDADPPNDGTRVDAASLAAFLDADRVGPPAAVGGIDALDAADGDELAFCKHDDPDAVAASNAGIVICPPETDPPDGGTVVHAARPRAAFVRSVDEFFGDESTETYVHPSAVVETDATVGNGCYVGAQAYVGDCVTLGDGCRVGHGTVLGHPGFGFARTNDDELVRQRHRGTVVLEDDVEVGANCTIDRAVFEETRIGRGTKLSGNVHLAHQVELGADVTVAFGAGFAGGVVVGDRTTVHPHVTVATDVTVGADAELGMNAAVLDDVPPETTVVGSPATPVGSER